jgi:hypothetical protein
MSNRVFAAAEKRDRLRVKHDSCSFFPLHDVSTASAKNFLTRG